MSLTLRTVALGIAVLGLLGLGATTVGAHPVDIAEDAVSTVGHVCDQFGLSNSWGDHHHGDQWSDHGPQSGPANGGYGPGSGYGPHHGPGGGYGPHHGSGHHGPGGAWGGQGR